MAKRCDRIAIVAKRRAGENVLHSLIPMLVTKPTHQQADVDTLRSLISVSLVEHNESEPIMPKDVGIRRSQQQILKHGEVRQKNMRWLPPSILAVARSFSSTHLPDLPNSSRPRGTAFLLYNGQTK